MRPPTLWSGGVGDQLVGEQQLGAMSGPAADSTAFTGQSTKGHQPLQTHQRLRTTGAIIRQLGADQTTLSFRENVPKTTDGAADRTDDLVQGYLLMWVVVLKKI